MSWLTPRRRFLLTIPLALLLPSGVLTYLGLQMVGLLDLSDRDKINEIVTDMTLKMRNETKEKLDEQLVKAQFRPTVQDKLPSLFPAQTDFIHHQFSLQKELEFAHTIFIKLSSNQLLFYQRDVNQRQNPSVWIYTEPVNSTFSDSLDVRINQEMQLKQSGGEQENLYLYFPYPQDRLYAQDREIAVFVIRSGNDAQSQIPEIVAAGFTLNFDYINKTFFQEIVDDAWNKDELKYPVMIHDWAIGKRVAAPAMIGSMELVESVDFQPKPFSQDVFYWYRLHFSDVTGKDIMEIIQTNRFIYYCLIASANIIMIVAIIGSIRNINQELILSDMRSDFVARVSHELRTPLGLIRLYSETLEMERTKDKDKQKEYLHAITKESERLTHLINNVLNFSQIEARRKHYKLVNTPIHTVVEESLNTILYHLERKGFEIHVEIQEDLPLLMCDREAMQLAIYNLLSNAMKYSHDEKQVELNVKQSGNEVVIEVKDLGIGIPKDQQKKIFQEFYRVDDPVVRSTGGSGLGLAVTKHIVEGHHGRLSVESEPGKGSLFRIHLPIHQTNHTLNV